MVNDAILVKKFLLHKASILLTAAEDKADSVIYYRLPFKCVAVIFIRNMYIGKYRNIRLPTYLCARVCPRIFLFFKPADILPMLKMKCIAHTVTVNLSIHIFRCILRRAKPQAIQPK